MTSHTDLDFATPVLVGVAQISEWVGESGWQGRSTTDLVAEAARLALLDAGVGATEIDVLASTRRFDDSIPFTAPPIGRPDNVPRAVGLRIGADPRHAIYEVSGGQSPQHLVTELAEDIAAGRASTVLIVGGEAVQTERHLATAADPPDLTEHVGGQLEDRGRGLRGLISRTEVDHGVISRRCSTPCVSTPGGDGWGWTTRPSPSRWGSCSPPSPPSQPRIRMRCQDGCARPPS